MLRTTKTRFWQTHQCSEFMNYGHYQTSETRTHNTPFCTPPPRAMNSLPWHHSNGNSGRISAQALARPPHRQSTNGFTVEISPWVISSATDVIWLNQRQHIVREIRYAAGRANILERHGVPHGTHNQRERSHQNTSSSMIRSIMSRLGNPTRFLHQPSKFADCGATGVLVYFSPWP